MYCELYSAVTHINVNLRLRNSHFNVVNVYILRCIIYWREFLYHQILQFA